MSAAASRGLTPHGWSRRRFVRGLAVGGAAVSAGLLRDVAWAQSASRTPSGISTGPDVDLRVGGVPVNVTGRRRMAIAINGSMPGPTLRWREGDDVRIRVTNELDELTAIHWHGITLPSNMDGVPGLSFHGIHPGQSYEYRFRLRQSGTYWYHSHAGFQESLGVYGAIVVDPREPEPFAFDREHVVVLSDWSDESPARIWAKLKKASDYYNFRQRTVGTFFADVARDGWGATLADRRQWAQLRMSAADLADVTGSTYTYLVNGQPPRRNWTGLFARGERVRLRVINASAMTYFDVRIPGLRMTVVAADGLPVRPIPVDEFRIAVAETYDVLVEPAEDRAYALVAQAMDRTGYAAGTLAPRPGLVAAVPPLDPRPALTMHDMGHAHASPPAVAADPHAGHVMAPPVQAPAPPDPHAGHGAPSSGTRAVQAHPGSENGNPLVDMQTQYPVPKLDDPGIGLRDNGRHVLTYTDLRSLAPDRDGREPSRTIELHLTGHMARFVWSFDGVKASDAEPIRLTYGERVRFVLVNDTMMTHPVHLHGMWSDLENEAGQVFVRKHTIDMPPGARRAFRVTANALGRWALHCHLLFHMDAGMFREVRVEESRS
jgi:CopA family copper-resistance protein